MNVPPKNQVIRREFGCDGLPLREANLFGSQKRHSVIRRFDFFPLTRKMRG